MSHPLSPAGRDLLNRRGFLAHSATGLGAIALASMLRGRVAEGSPAPLRPLVRPEVPLAPRPAHFAPRAKRVLVIFCSGACSQLDTWDYKPELIKRHGQPLPGGEKLVTFQGEQGALTRSPYAFRPRGQTGKYTSELLPRLGELVDEMCFV